MSVLALYLFLCLTTETGKKDVNESRFIGNSSVLNDCIGEQREQERSKQVMGVPATY